MINKDILKMILLNNCFLNQALDTVMKDLEITNIEDAIISKGIIKKENREINKEINEDKTKKENRDINNKIGKEKEISNRRINHFMDLHIQGIYIGKLAIKFKEYNEENKIHLYYIEKLIIKELEKIVLAEYYKKILNLIPNGVMILNKSGQVEYINEEGADTLNVKSKESLGKHIRKLVDFEPIILDVFKYKKGYRDREFIVNSHNKRIQFLKSATILKDENGNIICVVDTFEKIKDVRKVVNRMTGAYATFQFKDIIGSDKKFKESMRLAQIAARSSSNVLIYGESGTGKELCAHAIHNESRREKCPFISINCSAIPKDLLESELFGYDEGAFTGALKKGKAGKFELAQGGSIFLDEIGDMPLDMQAKLLRVLQDKKVCRIGSSCLIDLDVRIICATNKNLFKCCEEGSFRKDLYYRLNVLNIKMIPLRDRKSDIEELSNIFISKFNARLDKNIQGMDKNLKHILDNYNWPGNVRELENVIERAVNMCQSDYLTQSHIDRETFKINSIQNKSNKKSSNNLNLDSPEYKIQTLEEVEKIVIENTLDFVNGNITEAARLLGITRNTIYNKIKKIYKSDESAI